MKASFLLALALGSSKEPLTRCDSAHSETVACQIIISIPLTKASLFYNADMELHRVHNALHHSHVGEEKHEMLSLNRRLETYLNRVKLLEEDNALLAKEIQFLKHNEHRALTRRKGLEDDLQQARLEVDAAWRDRVHTELEVGRLTEELQALNLQRQREAQAHAKARTMLERSRKELDEEQRAQIWLREKFRQLEHEMRLLIQNHQGDVAHLEATLARSRATAQRGNQTPDLLQLGQEHSQRAARAWQEVAEACQGQLARLEESLSQARGRLSQVTQEKSEIQRKLQTLQEEVTSAQDVRLHLEKSAAQQRARHSQEVQALQEHLEGLEDKKEELGKQISRVILENRGLLQLKLSLGLEVAAYRALLDSESLTGHITFSNTDAALSPRGMIKNLQTTTLSSVYCATGAGLTVITAKPAYTSKPVTVNETPGTLEKTTDATQESSYPKILQDGAIENFRPQEVCERVTQAEPLSPPDEEEAVESPVPFQAEAGYSGEPLFNDDNSRHLFTASSPTPELFRITERPRDPSSESYEDVLFEGSAKTEELQEQPCAPADAQVKINSVSEDLQFVQEDNWNGESEALLEPAFACGTSSPESECKPEESAFNQPTDVGLHEWILKDGTVEQSQERSSQVGTNETDVEDKLYPDGEEMDTWDSVIERKVDIKTDDCTTKREEPRQHAEPEEDISSKEPEHEKGGAGQADVPPVQENKVASAAPDTQQDDIQHGALDQDQALLSDKEDDDSQNVSVSWRTEVESDSYAQENTLADTRPLIHYKSDETDANTHMDESEFSDSEQEKKDGETGTWSDGKSKKFGTMEDLFEEAEGEILEEEYDLDYAQGGDRNGGHSVAAAECVASVKGAENTADTIEKVNDGHSDEEANETAQPVASADVDYEEELDTDRLVEQELEDLCTDSYSAHFAQRQGCQNEGTSAEKEQEGTGRTETEAMLSCAEPEPWENCEASPPTEIIDHSYENPYLGDSQVTVPQTESLADDELQHKDGTMAGAPGKREEDDEHTVSKGTRAHEGEGDFTDLDSRRERGKMSNPKDSDCEQEEDLRQVAAPSETRKDVLVDAPGESQSLPDEADSSERVSFSEDTQSDEGYHHDDEGVGTLKEESTEVSPVSGPDESEIFVVNDPKELLDKSGENSSPCRVFSSAVKSDFWVSCAESSATCQAGDTFNEVAGPANQNLGCGENLVWGDLENTNVLDGKSRVDESGKAPDAEGEQEQRESDVQQVLCRNVAGELVHSEESEAEGESWSSGEEPI